MSLEYYIEQFRRLRMNVQNDHKSPHKVVMLLAVMDLMESGVLKENRIEYSDALLEKFRAHFEVMRSGSDRLTPYLPFYHLKAEGFWRHAVTPGAEGLYESLKDSNSERRIRECIAYAYLDQELFDYLTYSVTREQLKYALFENIEESARADLRGAIGEWSRLECDLISRDYLDMLLVELGGQSYSKSGHRRLLQPHLKNRTEGAIEYKYQNISAIMIDLGLPYIRGYKPAFNYQQLLAEVVAAHVKGRVRQLEEGEEKLAEAAIATPELDLSMVLVEAPRLEESNGTPARRQFAPRIYNYGERESRNRRLGEEGERFVLRYAYYRLETLGRSDLAKEIEWTSKVRGDGAGYDIRSFNHLTEAERFIEVKTTNSGQYQPFLITDNELAFSEQHPDRYSLYRVFEFKEQPRIFALDGSIRQHVHLAVRQYAASFR